MKRLLTMFLLGGGALAATLTVCAADWCQYRGPQANGITAEKVSTAWGPEGPKCLWRVPTPGGFSSFAIQDGKAFTVVSRTVDGAPLEVCVALDAATGKELWAAPTGSAKYQGGGDSGTEDNRGGDGPRSTPAVADGRVFVYSSDMVLHCLEAASGKRLWTKDVPKEFAGRNIGWKSAQSPLLEGKLVCVAGGGPGQSLLAFDQASGNLVWKTGDEALTHATPVAATIGGVRQMVFLMQSGLVAVEASAGKPLWKYAFPHRTCTACSPVVADDAVFCTASYEVGAALCQPVKGPEGFSSKEVWRLKGNVPQASLWSTPVAKDGYLYGMVSAKQYGRGPVKCIDLKTGSVKWEQPGFGTGQVILAGDQLIALADNGRVAVIAATPESFRELAGFKAVAGKCWSTPALDHGRLYVRSTKEGACFDLNSGK